MMTRNPGRGQRDTFANADTGEAGEQEGIGKQIVGAAEFLLQPLVIVGIQRPGKIVGLRRDVLAPNQIRLDGVTLGSQIIQQTAEAEEVLCAGGIV